MAPALQASSSPVHLNQEWLLSSASPLVSPSDQRFWSALNQRVESRKALVRSSNPETSNQLEGSKKRLFKDDSLMLIKGFDSVANSLSLLTSNLHNALQSAREAAKPSPSPLTDVIQGNVNDHTNAVTVSETTVGDNKQEENTLGEDDKKGTKRKLDAQDCPQSEEEISDNKKMKHQVELNHLKKLRNLAITMATKSASLVRELKSVKSEMCFLQEKCALLEEKNQRLRDGFDKGVRAVEEDDDLVRLQLEALLSEKSRLATENANLSRENQCLRQLVEYHQFASEDLSASYEQVIQGICLDFSSPIAKDVEKDVEDPKTKSSSREAFDFEFPSCLDASFTDEFLTSQP